jgi:hypothetical protein
MEQKKVVEIPVGYKAVVGYEGLYCVSESGVVKSPNGTKRPAVTNKGYLVVELYKDNVRKKALVHRLVAQAFIPNPKGYPNVCHKDDDPKNNSVGNLFWGTQRMNIQDMCSKGRNRNKAFKGEDNGSAKLRDSDIPAIKQLLLDKSCAEVSRMYGVDRTTISYIKRGITWVHLI